MGISLKIKPFSYVEKRERLWSPQDLQQMEKWIQQETILPFYYLWLPKSQRSSLSAWTLTAALYQGRQVKICEMIQYHLSSEKSKKQTNFEQVCRFFYAEEGYQTKKSRYIKVKLRDRWHLFLDTPSNWASWFFTFWANENRGDSTSRAPTTPWCPEHVSNTWIRKKCLLLRYLPVLLISDDNNKTLWNFYSERLTAIPGPLW